MATRKRFFTRHPLVVGVRVRVPDGWERMVTVDVSRRGLFLRTENPIALARIAQMEIELPTGQTLEAMGHVRRSVTEVGESGIWPGMGIEFFVMSKDAQDAWDRFVIEQKRRGALRLEESNDLPLPPRAVPVHERASSPDGLFRLTGMPPDQGAGSSSPDFFDTGRLEDAAPAQDGAEQDAGGLPTLAPMLFPSDDRPPTLPTDALEPLDDEPAAAEPAVPDDPFEAEADTQRLKAAQMPIAKPVHSQLEAARADADAVAPSDVGGIEALVQDDEEPEVPEDVAAAETLVTGDVPISDHLRQLIEAARDSASATNAKNIAHITVQPSGAARLQEFVERKIRGANVFMRTSVGCEEGQPVHVTVVHPDTDAEHIIAGTVKKVLGRGSTPGVLIRFEAADADERALLQTFVVTGELDVAAPPKDRGELDELRQQADSAPLSLVAQRELGWGLLRLAEKPADAIDQFLQALAVDGGDARTHDGLAMAYALNGDMPKAYAFIRSSHELREMAREQRV